MVVEAVGGPADEEDGHGLWPVVFQRVSVAAWDENGVARPDFANFFVDGHLPAALQDVINLFCLKVVMLPDSRPYWQHFFRKAAPLNV
jgi:hypothetical protein